jgi:uncharacterized damage-inducible protein DinB
MTPRLPEPWLRGPLEQTDPFFAPVLYSFQQAIEDLTEFTEGLSDEETWARPHGLAPVGFQLRHIAGSVDRLLTYALGGSLNDTQLEALKHELDAGEPLRDLLADLRQSLDQAAAAIRGIDPTRLTESRKVGRKELPTTVIGLLVHIAEHTQRHVGQAIVTAKIVRGMREAGRGQERPA